MPKKLLPLREKKYAETKKKILDAFLEKLKTKSLQEISIRELCEEIEISEGTFFNYFSHKEEVIIYFFQLWSIEVTWEANQVLAKSGPLKAIERIFEKTAEKVEKNHQIINEITAFLAKACHPKQPKKIRPAEYLQNFTDKHNIEQCPARDLNDVFEPLINQALETGELSKHADKEIVLLALRSTLFGVPISIRKNPEKIKKAYSQLLKLLWQSFN